MKTVLVNDRVNEVRKELEFSYSSFRDYLTRIGSKLSIILYNKNGINNVIAIMSLEDYRGYIFSEEEDMFVKSANVYTFVKDYLPNKVIFYSKAEVMDNYNQLFGNLVINNFHDILVELPNESGLILNVNPDYDYQLYIDKLLKYSDISEEKKAILVDKIVRKPVFIDIIVFSTSPSSNHILQNTITYRASVELTWTSLNIISREEVVGLIVPPTYQQRKLFFRRKEVLTPTTTIEDLNQWLKLPVSPRITEYFYNSFKLQREGGIPVGKLMNGESFNIAISDLPLYIYASSRGGNDLVRHIIHSKENVILVDTVGIGEEVAKELEITYLRPPYFGFNPITDNQAILDCILRILAIKDIALQRIFTRLASTLPNPTIPEIYRVLYNALHMDTIPYTDWAMYLLDFKKLPYKNAQHLVTTLGELVSIKDIRQTLSGDTVPRDVLKEGVIISIPVTEYGERIAKITASLLLLKLYRLLKDEDVIVVVNTHDNLPIIDDLLTRLNFKKIVYISRSPVIPSQSFKLKLYDFKRKNLFFVEGYRTLVQINKANYPIIRKTVITKDFTPETDQSTEETEEVPVDIRKTMNGVIRLMINSEFTSISELLERVKAIQGLIMHPSPTEIRLFLENLRNELRKVHRSDLGFTLTSIAYLYYVKKGYLDVRPVIQRPDKIRGDLEIPSVYTVVEIEADNPFKAVEQVKKNMIKWKDNKLVCEVHVWTTIDALETVFNIYKSLPLTAKSKIQIYAVDIDEKKVYDHQQLDEALEIVKKRRIEKEIKEVFTTPEQIEGDRNEKRRE